MRQKPGKSSLNALLRHAPQASTPEGSQRVGQIARIVFLDVMARALDVDPPPVGESRGEVIGSVFGDDLAFATPGQQERCGHVLDTYLEACEMLQDHGIIRRTTAVALPHEEP